VSRRSNAAALALALLGALGACQCRRPGEEPAKPVSPPAPEAHPNRGVKVPLADGWSARLGTEQSLNFGPPGRAVLRIDLRPGAAASKPDSAELARLFVAGLDGGAATVTAKKDQDGYSWVSLRLALGPAPATGGRDAGAAGEPALLGAKALDEDLFLCATLPGASEAEVESAARACEGISYSAVPRREP
jgi:hypothetical protein